MKLFSIFLSLFMFVSCVSASEFQYEKREIVINDIHIDVEIADTMDKRTRGLQFRNHLDPQNGMLFVYSEERYMGFWMKDTFIPLDLAYINTQGKIVELHTMDPYDKTVYRSRDKVRYVLEVNQGWFDEQGIQLGDSVRNLPKE